MNLDILEAAIEEAREREHVREQERRRDISDGFCNRVKHVFGRGVPSFFDMTFEVMGESTCAGVFAVEDERFHLIECDDQWRISKDDDRPESQPYLYRLFDVKQVWGEPEDDRRRKINLDRLLVALGELRTAPADDDLPF